MMTPADNVGARVGSI